MASPGMSLRNMRLGEPPIQHGPLITKTWIAAWRHADPPAFNTCHNADGLRTIAAGGLRIQPMSEQKAPPVSEMTWNCFDSVPLPTASTVQWCRSWQPYFTLPRARCGR